MSKHRSTTRERTTRDAKRAPRGAKSKSATLTRRAQRQAKRIAQGRTS